MDAVFDAHKAVEYVLGYDRDSIPERAIIALERAGDVLAAELAARETHDRLSTLIADARAAAGKLAEARKRAVELRARLRRAEEHAGLIEAQLTLSDAYAAGKNAEIRQAWLKLQRTQDPQWAVALADLEAARRESENAEAELSRLTDE